MDAREILLEKRMSLNNEQRSARQRAKGKLTARERIALLFDKETFHEISAFASKRVDYPGDGVIIGYGTINGQTVFCSSEDFSMLGGSVGEIHAAKIVKIMDMAYDARCPYISINDSGGARIDEGIIGLNGYGEIFSRNVKYSGVIPQISVILGPSAGGACYSPALMDAIFLVKDISYMFLTGPDVTKSVLFHNYSASELGGWQMHMQKSGVAHYVYDSETECFDGIRKFLSYLFFRKQNTWTSCPSFLIQNIIPDNPRMIYDVKNLLEIVFDENSIMEQKALYATNVVTAFARVEGRSVGVVANQPNVLSGSIDYKAGMKISRFVRFCDSFNLPIITFVDVPAFMPGPDQESNGIINHGAKIIYAYSEASVPLITIITRKAYGGAYIAMGSKSLGADVTYAWPSAEIAVMGIEGAISILYRHEIKTMNREEIAALKQEYKANYSNPYQAENALLIDEVIMPEETRERISCALKMLENKPHNPILHGNMPL